MATSVSKKRAITKSAPKAESVNNSETVQENEVVKTETKTRKKFEPTEGVLCRSVTVGNLWLEGRRSGELYNWVAYGDEIDVEYRDLVALVRSRSSYIYNPYFIIDDGDFLNEFPEVAKFYEDQYSITDLISILKMPLEQMIETIKILPPGANNTLRSLASTMVSDGTIDSLQTIRALDEVFGTELHLLSAALN